jgi:hypothetical protein
MELELARLRTTLPISDVRPSSLPLPPYCYTERCLPAFLWYPHLYSGSQSRKPTSSWTTRSSSSRRSPTTSKRNQLSSIRREVSKLAKEVRPFAAVPRPFSVPLSPV